MRSGPNIARRAEQRTAAASCRRVAVAALVAFAALVGPSAQAQPAGSGDGSGEAAATPPVVPADAAPVVPADAAPAAEVEVSGPAAPVAVGEPALIDVSVTLPTTSALASVSVVGNPYVEALEVIDVAEAPGSVQRQLRVAVFRSGAYEARVSVSVLDAQGLQHHVESDVFTVDVTSSIVNETDPQPAPEDPAMPVMTRDMRPIWGGMALGFLALGFLIARMRGTAELAEEVAPEAPRRPPWEVAFEALDALAESTLLEDGAHLEFHMRLSEILRAYLGARFHFAAPEMTTMEIRAWMRLHPERAGAYEDEISEVLAEMDMVKFARFEPPLDDSLAALESARHLVDELSARHREIAAGGEGVAASTSGPAPKLESDAGAQAPSPESTTDAFAAGEVLPDNVVRFAPPRAPDQLPVDDLAVDATPDAPERALDGAPAAEPAVDGTDDEEGV